MDSKNIPSVKAVPKLSAFKRAALFTLLLFVILFLSYILSNAIIIASSSSHMFSYSCVFESSNEYAPDELLSEGKYDCIIVLGAKVDGTRLSSILEDRTLTGIYAYKAGVSDRIIMSGDHGRIDYDEVNAMREYAEAEGVESDSIFLDHAGFSTYETIYRAKHVFGAKRVLIVTQKYHLYRAVYIARAIGLDADGIYSDLRTYGGMPYFELRETAARFKDFFKVLLPEKSFSGDTFSLAGSGTVTHDKPVSA